jgi:hypothetical protein
VQVETEINELLKNEPGLIEGLETFVREKGQNKVEDVGAELANGVILWLCHDSRIHRA